MISIARLKSIYKLNIPNLFTTPMYISIPRVMSCHLRWLATLLPQLSSLLGLAYTIEHRASQRTETWVEMVCQKLLKNIDLERVEGVDRANRVIWTAWWQGEEEAPEIVKSCIKRMRDMSSDAKVIVIDSANYMDYVSLPDFILELKDSGRMSMAHFSDILRTCILSEYGGLWIDSTIWLHRPIEAAAFDKRIYSVKFTASAIVKADWGYPDILFFMCIMGGTNRYFYKLIYDMLIEIWNVQKNVVNYLIFDKVVRVLYRRVPAYKLDIDTNVVQDELEIISGENRFNLRSVLSKQDFCVFVDSRRYTKLTYKFIYPKEIDGQKTLYGWMVSNE